MIAHFKRPAAMRPGSSVPPIQLADARLNSLAAFLLKLTPANASAWRRNRLALPEQDRRSLFAVCHLPS
ncbi:MAG TPA: hypothetical protein VML19_26955 [Verrucomicrobiae bacterium]|nr:hypothetical protein [Verrucomicrobiae bacterium]